jgi:hypothetical protein
MGRGYGDLLGDDGDQSETLGLFLIPGRMRQKVWEADVRL